MHTVCVVRAHAAYLSLRCAEPCPLLVLTPVVASPVSRLPPGRGGGTPADAQQVLARLEGAQQDFHAAGLELEASKARLFTLHADLEAYQDRVELEALERGGVPGLGFPPHPHVGKPSHPQDVHSSVSFLAAAAARIVTVCAVCVCLLRHLQLCPALAFAGTQSQTDTYTHRHTVDAFTQTRTHIREKKERTKQKEKQR